MENVGLNIENKLNIDKWQEFPVWMLDILNKEKKIYPLIEGEGNREEGEKDSLLASPPKSICMGRGQIKNVTYNYFWFREEGIHMEHTEQRDRIWKKDSWEQLGKAYSYSCRTPLPQAFSVTFKIRNFVKDCFGVFGVSDTYFPSQPGWLSWTKGQYAFCTNGQPHSLPLLGTNCHKPPKYPGTKTGDLFELCFTTDKKLSMRHNGKLLSHLFHDVHPPLYICASMYHDNSALEIMEVWDITHL